MVIICCLTDACMNNDVEGIASVSMVVVFAMQQLCSPGKMKMLEKETKGQFFGGTCSSAVKLLHQPTNQRGPLPVDRG